jgi:hypothetical protein
MKTYITKKRARSLVSATGWHYVKNGRLWPVDDVSQPEGLWLGHDGSRYYLTDKERAGR